MKNILRREILKYLGEMIIVLVLSTVAYIGLTKGTIASFASIAQANDNINLDLQVLYGRDADTVKYSDNLLAKGELSVKNPNKHAVTADINFKISTSVNLDSIDIIVNGRPLDVSKKTIDSDFYIIPVTKYEISAYETVTFATGIYGNPYNTPNFDYFYDIKESFY